MLAVLLHVAGVVPGGTWLPPERVMFCARPRLSSPPIMLFICEQPPRSVKAPTTAAAAIHDRFFIWLMLASVVTAVVRCRAAARETLRHRGAPLRGTPSAGACCR